MAGWFWTLKVYHASGSATTLETVCDPAGKTNHSSGKCMINNVGQSFVLLRHGCHAAMKGYSDQYYTEDLYALIMGTIFQFYGHFLVMIHSKCMDVQSFKELGY